MAVPADIVLGDGVFAIGSTTTTTVSIALTRGGGRFSVEREYRNIEADGDYGPVKNRLRLIRSVAKLEMNALEINPAYLDDYYPSASSCYSAGDITAVLTGAGMTSNISSSDYNYVTWTGYNKAGRRVYIELQNAINLENIDWGLMDKDELINKMVFQATYSETARSTEPWKVIFTTTSS